MKRTIRLSESELINMINRIINEDIEMMDVSSDSDYYKARKREVSIPRDDLSLLYHMATNFCNGKGSASGEKLGLPDCRTVRDIGDKYSLFM